MPDHAAARDREAWLRTIRERSARLRIMAVGVDTQLIFAKYIGSVDKMMKFGC